MPEHRVWTIHADGPDGKVPHFYAESDLDKLDVVPLDWHTNVILDKERDWIETADRIAAERDRLEARVAELEAALVESNKNTLTPQQQGEIAARALFPLRKVEGQK